MNNDSREVRREFELTRARFETEVEHAEAVIRDYQTKQTEVLALIGQFSRENRKGDVETAAQGYGWLVMQEMKLVEEMARLRAMIEKLNADITETERIERELS